MSENGAKKFDNGKPPIGLIPYEYLEAIGKVLGFGADRYGSYNWSAGMDWLRPYSAMLRHAGKWEAGEDLDDDSGLHHMAHVAANAMFLYMSFLYKIGVDNRWQRPNQQKTTSQQEKKLNEENVKGSQEIQEWMHSFGCTPQQEELESANTQETPCSCGMVSKCDVQGTEL